MSIIESALNKANKVDNNSTVHFTTQAGLEVNTNKQWPINNNVESKVSSFTHQQLNKEIFEIDFARLTSLGFVDPNDSNTQTIEEYRNIKRPIVNNAFGKGSLGINRANLILITSSLPGEGKTFTAINLALSMPMLQDPPFQKF
jgi:Mrp family chromosome partitioning ATPase